MHVALGCTSGIRVGLHHVPISPVWSGIVSRLEPLTVRMDVRVLQRCGVGIGQRKTLLIAISLNSLIGLPRVPLTQNKRSILGSVITHVEFWNWVRPGYAGYLYARSRVSWGGYSMSFVFALTEEYTSTVYETAWVIGAVHSGSVNRSIVWIWISGVGRWTIY